MQINRTLLCLAIVAGLAAASAHAAPPVTNATGNNKLYLGAKLGMLMPDYPGYDNIFNIGVYGGYHLLGSGSRFGKDLGGGTLSLEGELNTTILDGDAGAFGDWDMTNLGAYAAYRYPLNQLYLKGKAGVVRQDINTGAAGAPGRGSETDISLGIGAGWNLGSSEIEVEFTLLDNHVNFLSVGYIF